MSRHHTPDRVDGGVKSDYVAPVSGHRTGAGSTIVWTSVIAYNLRRAGKALQKPNPHLNTAPGQTRTNGTGVPQLGK